jgi:hypothetical protein
MVAPFNQAWMLLKQRGHELNLPPQSVGIKGMGSPQDLTDKRVDAADRQKQALNEIEMAGTQNPQINSMADAMAFLDNQRFNQKEMEDQLHNASREEGNEQFLQDGQSELDRAILARMGQQPEADEIEAMGVPPMSRTLSATPPPNIGRAGSSGRPPVGSDDMSNELASMDPDFHESHVNALNRLGPFTNPFPKPAGQNIRGDLMDWAAGAGRKGTGKPTLPNKNFPEEFMKEPLDGFHNSPAPAGESEPTQMDTPNTVTTSPRMSRRNRPNASAPTPRMRGRANRKGLPF